MYFKVWIICVKYKPYCSLSTLSSSSFIDWLFHFTIFTMDFAQVSTLLMTQWMWKSNWTETIWSSADSHKHQVVNFKENYWYCPSGCRILDILFVFVFVVDPVRSRLLWFIISVPKVYMLSASMLFYGWKAEFLTELYEWIWLGTKVVHYEETMNWLSLHRGYSSLHGLVVEFLVLLMCV